MESKLGERQDGTLIGAPFNRTSMESKRPSLCWRLPSGALLLIEPVWNRNLNDLFLCVPSIPFNRTSMESKLILCLAPQVVV